MASNSTVSAYPNPDTPLAFLPPTLADQFQASCYLYVAGLAAFIWDWLMSMPDEYRILRRSNWSLPNVAYFLSRFGTLGFCTAATIFQAGSVEHCQALLYIIGGFYVIAIPSTSLLFFFRVRAVYSNSPYITWFFGLVWISLLGLSVCVPLSIDGGHIGPTKRCINTVVRSYGSTPIILNAIYDTLVFLTISFRIVSFTFVGETKGAQIKSFFFGDGLPRMSKGLLQGGQLYYFATIGLSIVTSAMVLAPGVPAVYHAMFTIPNIALENSMACRVFRAVKLGLIKDPNATTTFGTTIGTGRGRYDTGPEFAMKQRAYEDSRNMSVNVEITRTMDVAEDTEDGYISHKSPALVDDDSKTSLDPSHRV